MANRNIDYTISIKDRMSGKLSRIEAQTKSTTRSFNALNSIIGGLSIGALMRVGTEAIKTASKYESLNKAIEFSSGNALQAKINFDFLRKTSDELGLSYEAVTAGFKTFSGAMRGSSITAARQRDMFMKVSKASKVMQLSADDTKGVFLAMGQIMSKNKVQAEELRGQIGERLPGAFAIAAKAMGKTTAELDKMMADGKLLATDFLPKFADQLDKEFAGGIEDAVKSISTDLNKLENQWELTLSNMGKQIASSGIVSGLASIMTEFNKATGMQDKFNKYQQERFGKSKSQMLNPFGVSEEERLFFKASMSVEKEAEMATKGLNMAFNKMTTGNQDFFKLNKAFEFRNILTGLEKEYKRKKDIRGIEQSELQPLRKKIEFYKQLQNNFGQITTKVSSTVDSSEVKASDKEMFGTTLTARSPKVFNINIENLIDDGVHITSQTAIEGVQDMGNIVINELMKDLVQLEQVSQ